MGLAVALFLVDRRGKLAATIRFVADVMSGIPSIAIGIFAYALIVVPSGHYSGITGSFALAVLMLPIIVRADEVAMRTVPEDLWDAALALGARPSRVARSVVVRTALPGLVTGNLLAVARAAGETAPLLFTALGSSLFTTNPFQPMDAMPHPHPRRRHPGRSAPPDGGMGHRTGAARLHPRPEHRGPGLRLLRHPPCSVAGCVPAPAPASIATRTPAPGSSPSPSTT